MIDKRSLRKACIRLSMATKTPIKHFFDLTLPQLNEMIEDVKAVLDEK